MKKLFVCLGCALLWTIAPINGVSAQDPITLIIKEGIVKVIKAVDLKIQRLQNKTIWLQNAQKTLENSMSKLKLDEISGWVEKQRTLYKVDANYIDLTTFNRQNILLSLQRAKDQNDVDVVQKMYGLQ